MKFGAFKLSSDSDVQTLKFSESSEGLIQRYHKAFKGADIDKHKVFDMCIVQCRADLGV